MASEDLIVLEIGAVQLLEKDHRIRIGIDSCAAVTVFPKSVADDYPMLDTPGKAKSYRPASGKLLPDLCAREVQVKLRDGSLRYPNPKVADTHRASMAVSEMNDSGHDVFFPRSDRGIKAYAYHASSGTRLESVRSYRVASRTCPIQPEYIEEQHIRFVFFTSCSGKDQGHDGQGYDCGPPKLTGTYNAVSPTKEVILQPLVSIGGSSGSRDVICPIPGGGLLGDRPVVPGGRESTEREEQLQRKIEGDAAQGPVVKAKKAPSVPSLVEWDGHLACPVSRMVSILRCWQRKE